MLNPFLLHGIAVSDRNTAYLQESDDQLLYNMEYRLHPVVCIVCQ